MSEPLGLLAVDDEAPARSKIARFVAADARFRCIGEATNGIEALDAIERLRPDVVVLDVQMPAVTGLEVALALTDLGERAPAIVFSTAYEAHAVQAFEANAVDYLLKPYDAARFTRALDKVCARVGRSSDGGVIARLAESVRSAPTRSSLTVRGEGGWISVPFDDIVRITAAGKHVDIVLRGTTVSIRQTLAATLARLDPARFVRVHRSEVVHVAAVERLEPWTHGDGIAVLRDGSSVVVSRTYRRGLVERMRG